MFLQSDLVRLFCLYSDVVSFALFPLSIWTLGLELLEHFLDESSVGSKEVANMGGEESSGTIELDRATVDDRITIRIYSYDDSIPHLFVAIVYSADDPFVLLAEV